MNAFQPARLGYRSPLSLAIAGALASATALPALAQDAARAATPATAATDTAVELDTVVVTANKRVENIREVGAAISVVGERQLENMGASSLSDYAALIPGLQVQNDGGPGLTAISLRGVAALSSSATVATYIDEVPLGSSGIYHGELLHARPAALRHQPGRGDARAAGHAVRRRRDRRPAQVRHPLARPEQRRAARRCRPALGGKRRQRLEPARRRQPAAAGGSPRPAHELRPQRAAGLYRQRGRRCPGRQRRRADRRTRGAGLDGEAFDADLGVLHQSIDSDGRAGIALDPDSLRPLFGDFTDRTWSPQPFSKDFTPWSLGQPRLGPGLGRLRLGDRLVADRDHQPDRYDRPVRRSRQPAAGPARAGQLLHALQLRPRQADPGVPPDLQERRRLRVDDRRVLYQGGRAAEPARAPAAGRRHGAAGAVRRALRHPLALLNLPSTYKEFAVFANGSLRINDRFKIDAGVRQGPQRAVVQPEQRRRHPAADRPEPGRIQRKCIHLGA
ncbi:TonB-dependent receptor plug domain-containing protein [Pseudoxanthomonas sp. NC8]|nr:TonB-dependent receptor plug domain-containing protein [Pseudoxanthomonas sp. NC8]